MQVLEDQLKTLSKEYLIKINNWVTNNGWAGWDPYDIYNNKFGLWVGRRENIFQKASGVIISQLNQRFPVNLRNLINIKPSINPKAMGLFAAGYLQLDSLKKTENLIMDKFKYDSCFRWLEANKVEKYGGCGWGYPFDWMSRVLIPKNTPTVVNSAIIGDAYWLKYKLFNDVQAFSQCETFHSIF